MTQIKNPFAFPPASNSSTQPKPRSPQSTPPPSPMAPLASEAARSVNCSVELLRRLQSVEGEVVAAAAAAEVTEETASKEELLSSALLEVRRVKERVLWEVPQRHRVRVLPQEGQVTPLREFPLLFGRCFNLSLNLKILHHAQCLDATLAARILSDLCVLEASLQDKLDRARGVVKQEDKEEEEHSPAKSTGTRAVGRLMGKLKLNITPRPKLSFT